MTAKDKKIIADSEATGTPIFVLTAKDLLSWKAINLYRTQCVHNLCKPEHLEGITKRLVEFKAWQKANPDKVKLPD
jgi:hypothetical protein